MTDRTSRLFELCWLGLVVVTPSLVLVPVYGSWAPVAVWATGVVVAGVAGAVVVLTGWPGWVAVPLVLLVTVLAGPSVVAGAVTAPVGEPLRDLLRSSLSGWRELITVAVPVGTAPGLLVPMLCCGVVTGSVVAVAVPTRRWYPAALLGLPLGAVTASVLGPGELPWWPIVAMAVAAVAGLVWVVVRRSAGAPTVAGAPWQRLRRPVTGAIVVVVAIAAGTAGVLAAGTTDRLALRETLAVPVTPVSVPSPLVEFRHLSVDLAAEELLTVSGVRGGDRLRLAALDTYDGIRFTVGDAGGAFARLGTSRDVSEVGAERAVTMTVGTWSGEFLPTVGELRSITFGGPRATGLTDSFRYAARSRTGVLPGGTRSGDTWQQTGVVAIPPDASAVSVDRLAVGDFPGTAALPEVLRAAAAEITDRIASPGDQLTALQDALVGGYYSQGLSDQLRSPSGHGLNRMVDMVSSTTMVGDEEQYATLMALLARSLGIPARVVVGFEVPEGTDGGEVTVTGAQVTAWVEVPFVDAGWVAYDPTPPRERTALDVQPPARAGRHVADNQPPPAGSAGDQAQVQADSAGRQDEGEDEDRPDHQPVGGLPWWGWVTLGLGALLLLGALPLLLVSVWKVLRRRRRRRGPDPAGRVRAAWRDVLDTARDTGFRPARTGTRTDISADLFAATGVDTRSLAAAADGAEFVPHGSTVPDADRQWTAAAGASTALLALLPTGRHLRARWSTTSLRRLPADR